MKYELLSYYLLGCCAVLSAGMFTTTDGVAAGGGSWPVPSCVTPAESPPAAATTSVGIPSVLRELSRPASPGGPDKLQPHMNLRQELMNIKRNEAGINFNIYSKSKNKIREETTNLQGTQKDEEQNKHGYPDGKKQQEGY
jgi:hypothetical protein